MVSVIALQFAKVNAIATDLSADVTLLLVSTHALPSSLDLAV